MNKLDQIKAFFARPGINKSGVLEEAGISFRYMGLVLEGKRPLSPKTISKLWPVMEKYGWGR